MTKNRNVVLTGFCRFSSRWLLPAIFLLILSLFCGPYALAQELPQEAQPQAQQEEPEIPETQPEAQPEPQQEPQLETQPEAQQETPDTVGTQTGVGASPSAQVEAEHEIQIETQRDIQRDILRTPAAEPAEDVQEARWIDLPFEVTGSYRADYYGRWNTDDKNDQQLFQYLYLNLLDVVPNKVSVHFLGRLSAELNGTDDGDDFFFDIYDTFSGDVNARIYYLYADIKDPVFERSNLRLGHQNSYEGQSVFFTGAKYDQTIERLRFYLQGGVWASHYQSTDVDDSTIGGLGFDYQLLRNTAVGYDYLRLVDDELDDDYHTFNISQRFGSLKTFGQFSLLNSDPDFLNLYGSYYHEPLDLNLTAWYYTLLSERGRLTNQFSALVDLDNFDIDDDDTLGTLFPFHLVNLNLYKGWGERFATTGGFETRWMDDGDEKNEFNREYDRYFVTFEVWDFWMKGLSTAFTFEYWDINAGEDSIAAGVDLEKDMNERLNLAGGFFFWRYRLRTPRFNAPNISEEFETPEAYIRARYKLRENIELLAKYEVEYEDEFGTTHEVRLGVVIDF